jgi:hypothetical protein
MLVTHFIYCYAECLYAECRSAHCAPSYKFCKKNNYQGLFVDCLDFEIQDSELEIFAEKQNK